MIVMVDCNGGGNAADDDDIFVGEMIVTISLDTRRRG